MKFRQPRYKYLLLKVFTQPTIPSRLSNLLEDTISIKANAMAKMPTNAITQASIEKMILQCVLVITSSFFKKIPAPIDDPITNIIVDKKPIFFFVDI
jgi:hypothetical protein